MMVLLLRLLQSTNSKFPDLLADKQDGVIIPRCTGLYPAFCKIFFQVLLHFLQFFFTNSLKPLVKYRLFRVQQLVFVLDFLCNTFAWLCKNISILIDPLLHGVCKSFTRIIRYLRKLRNIQLYLVIILLCIEIGQRINLILQFRSIFCSSALQVYAHSCIAKPT